VQKWISIKCYQESKGKETAGSASTAEPEGVEVRKWRTRSGSIEYYKTLPTTGSRIICNAYHPTKEILFGGYVDGSIRSFDAVRESNHF